MTEIPEHLLKRAAERRAAMGDGGDAPADAPAAAGAEPAAPADAPATAVEKAKAAPAPLPTLDDDDAEVVPDSPVVAAAKQRKRVPYWAAPVLAMLPLWGFMYVSSVSVPPAGENDPLVIGRELYVANCAGCHMPNGDGVNAGGTGQVLSGGEVLKTFADPLGVAYWVHYGTDGGARPDGTYGDLTREGGARNVNDLTNNMGGFDLDPEEMAAVVIYIREVLSGGDPADDPNFNSEVFMEDPAALAALVEEVVALDPDDPDAVATVEGAETE